MLTAGNLVELRLMVEIDPIPESREKILAWFWFMGNKYKCGSVARLQPQLQVLVVSRIFPSLPGLWLNSNELCKLVVSLYTTCIILIIICMNIELYIYLGKL